MTATLVIGGVLVLAVALIIIVVGKLRVVRPPHAKPGKRRDEHGGEGHDDEDDDPHFLQDDRWN